MLNKESDIHIIAARPPIAAFQEDVGQSRHHVVVYDSLQFFVSEAESKRRDPAGSVGRSALLVAMENNTEHFLRAVRAGARGYVLQEASIIDIATAIRAVARKEVVCPVHLMSSLFDDHSVRVIQQVEPNRTSGSKPDVYIFYNKITGSAQFHAEAGSTEQDSIERAAGLLAIHCLVRGQDPENFIVLVPAADVLSGRLVSRAKELLKEGRSISGPAPLSPRQKEILQSVVRNQANKEIASNLNITVRTVKFHISSLLTKFDVQSRDELARKAAGLFKVAEVQTSAAAALPEGAPLHELMTANDARSDRPGPRLPLPGRVRTA